MNPFVKMRKRGLIWIFLGVVLYLGGILIMERPFVLRGTRVPFGLVLVGLGVVLLVWDLVHYRRERAKDPPPDLTP
jgi:hypothetical protein